MSLNVTFKRASIEAAAEFGSLNELAGYIGEQSTLLTKLFGEDMEIVVKGLTDTTAIATDTETGETGTAASKKRGRPAKNQPDPSTATAPPPAPIPGATPTAPAAVPADLAAQVAGANGGIPAFLDRTAAPVPPAAPPAPPPPPPAPVVPPSGLLAGKVIAALDARAADDSVKVALVNWLASPGLGLVQPNATYPEAIDAIRLMSDDKLANAAVGLQITA
ncbi:hypothetical protein [Bradyrhizobium liaoningense]